MAQTLTARRLEAIQPPPSGRVELLDDVARGLCWRVTATGERTWSLRLKVNGRSRRFPIGEYPAVSIAEARKRAGKLRADALEGRDPIEEKRAARAEREAKAALTTAGVLETYASLHLATLADGRRRGSALRAALKRHLARPIAELRRADLQAAIDAKAKSAPIAANRLKAALVHFAGWAKRRGYLAEPIGLELEKPTREQPRERVLTLEELGAIWQASRKLDPLWGGFLRLLMLTAQRRGDVAGMRWEELEGQRWAIPGSRTKNRRPHIVHLAAASLAELAALRADAEAARGLIFTTTGATPVSGFGRLKARLDELSGVAGWTLHDFRTAFASHLAEGDVAEGVVDRVLNHAASASSASAVARVYQRSELLPQRARALERWAEMLLRAAGEAGAATVVELRRQT